MAARPTGIVAFLLTDIEGSTAMWEEDRERAAIVLAEHDHILNQAIAEHDGVVFSKGGDSFAAAFHTPAAAVSAAVTAQQTLVEVAPVRMAVHVGDADERGGDYFGPTLNRCGRLRDAAHGGQVVCSQAVADLYRPSEGTVLIDLGEHSLRDVPLPERVFQISGPGLRSEFPPLPTLARATNLPADPTSFVGRGAEVGQLRDLIDKARLVTLTGAGGSGKSRLAVEAGRSVSDSFPEGVWFIDLTALADPDLVGHAIASVLQLRETTDRPLSETLVAYLSRRRVMLILDNCEHLLDPVGRLVDALVSETADTHVVATSQAPLRVHGEYLFPVAPLPVPKATADAASILKSPSVQLFIDRATAARPDLEFTEGTAPVVASISRRLDGIPLAIELAATTVRLLPLDEIDRRLDDRFGLLGHGPAHGVPHHETLEAAIDWSFQLLTDPQQTLLTRLGVFEGGWSFDAAESICTAAPLRSQDVLPLLGDLVDRSLVAVVDDAGEARYRLLESIQAYVRRVPESTPALAHARYYTELAERLAERWGTSSEPEALMRYHADFDNFLSALDYLDSVDEPALYSRLLVGLAQFLGFDRLYDEAEPRFERALRELPGDADPGLRGRLLLAAARNATGVRLTGPGERSDRLVMLTHQALPYIRDAGDDRALGRALSFLVQYEDEGYAEEAMAAARRAGDSQQIGGAHLVVGQRAFLSGRHETACERFRAARDEFEAPGDRMIALSWLALAESRLGDLHSALEHSQAALDITEELNDLPGVADNMGMRAEILIDLGEPERALDALDRQIDLQRELFGAEEAGTHAESAYAAVMAGDARRGLDHLRALRAIGTEPGDDLLFHDQLDRVFLAVALLFLGRSDPTTAAEALGARSAYRITVDIPPSQPRTVASERVTGQVADALDAETFEAAWQRGVDMPLDRLLDGVVEAVDGN